MTREELPVMNYGGGRQSIAIVVLVMREIIERPSKIIMADTGRESPGTFAYLATHVQPLLATIGLRVEVIKPSVPQYPTTYGVDAKPLLPMYSRELQNGVPKDGKFSSFCTGTWKRDRMAWYLSMQGWPKCERWIGFAFDEKRRISRLRNSNREDGYTYRFPLDELMLETPDCIRLVESYGLPSPKVSRCWLCPHQKNAEWREIREQPDLWESACREDEEQREQDLFRGGLGVWLHHSRVPLREANIDTEETVETVRQCSLGACFV